MVNDKGASTAEPTNGGHSVLHVGTDQINVINLQIAEMVPCHYSITRQLDSYIV